MTSEGWAFDEFELGQLENDIGAITRRVEDIALLLAQIGDTGWVTELISMLPRPGWSGASADLLMVELTIADVERSAKKLLALRANLFMEVSDIGPSVGRPSVQRSHIVRLTGSEGRR